MSAPATAPARLSRRVRLGDLRLWAGLALMAIAVVAGGRLLAGDEDLVVAMRAARDLAPGTPVDVPNALEPVRVPRAIAQDRYLAPDDPALAGIGGGGPARLAQPVRAGELVPVAAVATGPREDVRTVTVPVDPLHAPPGLLPGDRVDVWSTPREPAPGEPVLVLPAAAVAAVPGADVGLGGEVGVVLAVPVDQVGAVVAATRAGQVDLVAVPVDVVDPA